MTTNGADAATAARAVAGEAARAFQDVFTERLAAAYLLGSLTHGDYAPAVSDIDLAVILTDKHGGDPGTIDATCQTLRQQDPLHRKLSVFWGSLPAIRHGHDDGRFPAIDRLDLADHGQLLLGGDVADDVARPTAEDLLLESAQFAIDVLATDEVTTEFHHPRRLLDDPMWFTKAVLFPVRFLYTNSRSTGRAAKNDEAIAWYLTEHTQSAAPPLVRLAARVRAGEPLDPAQVTPQLAAGLFPLYQHYIDDQTRRLRRVNAPANLITAFTQWGRRLVRDCKSF